MSLLVNPSLIFIMTSRNQPVKHIYLVIQQIESNHLISCSHAINFVGHVRILLNQITGFFLYHIRARLRINLLIIRSKSLFFCFFDRFITVAESKNRKFYISGLTAWCLFMGIFWTMNRSVSVTENLNNGKDSAFGSVYTRCNFTVGIILRWRIILLIPKKVFKRYMSCKESVLNESDDFNAIERAFCEGIH